MTTRYELRYGADSSILIGVAKVWCGGWRFFPRQSGRAPSRVPHQTALDSVPAWARKYMPAHGGEWRKVEA